MAELRPAYPNELYGTHDGGDYLMHWKYLRKVKTASGKTRYIYDSNARSNNPILNTFATPGSGENQPKIEQALNNKVLIDSRVDQTNAESDVRRYEQELAKEKEYLESVTPKYKEYQRAVENYKSTHPGSDSRYSVGLALIKNHYRYDIAHYEGAVKRIAQYEKKLQTAKQKANGGGEQNKREYHSIK